MPPAQGGVGGESTSNRPDLETIGSAIFGHIWLDALFLKPVVSICKPDSCSVNVIFLTVHLADKSYPRRQCNTPSASTYATENPNTKAGITRKSPDEAAR